MSITLDGTIPFTAPVRSGPVCEHTGPANMTMPDPAQIKQGIRQTFDLVAAGYETPTMRYFPFSADQLVMYLKPVQGERILDVATGTGLVAVAIGQMLGSAGRVQAIDISDSMLDKALQKVNQAGLGNIDLHNMDAERLDFKSSYFDAACCSFGLFFLPDMLQGSKEILRVLKPGGRFVSTSFANTAFQPMAQLLREQLTVYGVSIPEDNWYRLASDDECLGLLTKAGFINTQVARKQMGYHLAGSLDWWDILYNSGFRGLLEQLEPSHLADFRHKHLAAIDKLKTDKGIWMDVEVIFSMGHRPA